MIPAVLNTNLFLWPIQVANSTDSGLGLKYPKDRFIKHVSLLMLWATSGWHCIIFTVKLPAALQFL